MIEANVIKQFQYILEIEGMPMLSMQEVTPPEVEIEETMHSVGTYDIKTPGRIKVSDLVCKKVMAYEDTLDSWAWNWLLQAQDFELGGLIPDNYIKNGRLIYTAPDLKSILQTYELGNIWVKKISTDALVRNSSDNIIETVTFSVSKFRKVL